VQDKKLSRWAAPGKKYGILFGRIVETRWRRVTTVCRRTSIHVWATHQVKFTLREF